MAELKLEIDPFRSSFPLGCAADPRRALTRADGLNPPATSTGGDAPSEVAAAVGPSGRDREGAFDGEEMVVDARLSARSEEDNSLDRVRLIFFDGDCPMMGEGE